MIRDAVRRAGQKLLRLTLSPTARRVLDRRLTYLTPRKLRNLEHCLRALDRGNVAGDYIECGVALGGSAIVLASHLTPGRRFRGYDAFSQIPPPSEKDNQDAHKRYRTIAEGRSTGIGGDKYYGYLDDLLLVVTDNLTSFGIAVDNRAVTLIPGLFENTLRFDPHDQIALAHVDCDWYEPVRFALSRIYERLSPGGFIVIDDFNDYDGCRSASEEFLASKSDLRLRSTRGNAVIQRI